MRILYRIRQAWQAGIVNPRPSDLSQLTGILTPPMLEIFNRQKPFEKAHSIQVYQQLVRTGEKCEDLLIAALLHDIGKIRFPLHLWERAVIVLFRSLFPDASRNWGTGEPAGWRRPFVVAENHPVWGKEIALQAGVSPLTATIIERHQEPRVFSNNGRVNITGDQDQNSEVDLLVYKLQMLDHQN